MTSAKSRRAALRKLLLSGRGGTQDQLRELLADRGFGTTQSTISRDLKLLGAQRRLEEDGDYHYELDAAGLGRFPVEMVVAVEHNEHQIIVKTRIGRAQAVGLELDALRDPDLLGTVAGDDTVLVIPRTVHKTAALARRILALAELEPLQEDRSKS